MQIIQQVIKQKIVMQQRPNSTSTHHTNESLSAPPNFFQTNMQLNFEDSVLCCGYLASSDLIVLGGSDGVGKVVSVPKQAIQYELVKEDRTPVTSLSTTSSSSSIKNTVMIAHSGGTLEYWHATSKQLLFSKQYSTILQTCSISPNSQYYTLSAESGVMYLGNLDKGNPSILQTGQLGSHANRVFCLKWHPQDPNIFFSAGWDRAVFMWDVRTKTSVKTIFGYYVGGSAIDVSRQSLLIGNNQNDKQLRIYDLKSQKTRVLPWDHYSTSSANSTTGVNNCFFVESDKQIIAMTSKNEIRHYKQQKCISVFKHSDEQARGYSMSPFTQNRSLLASWNNGDVKIMSY